MQVQSCFCANLTRCFFAVLADVSVVVVNPLCPFFQGLSAYFYHRSNEREGRHWERTWKDDQTLFLLLLLLLFSFLTSLALDKKCRLVRSSRALRNRAIFVCP